MTSVEATLQNTKGILHLLFFLFFIIPYYIIEALFFSQKVRKTVNGENVLITGTGHGIGKWLALKYASEGATVVGWDINEELNTNTIQEIAKMGYPKAYGYKVDVSNRENVMATAKKVEQAVGNVTILINNAGIMPHHAFLDHTEKEIQRIMDINVMGNFWTIQAFLPAMRKNNHGHIVAISSMAGLLGLVNLVPYNASKFAVRGLMEGLYEEYRRFPNNNVHFTTIYPYIVDTGLCQNMEITYPNVSPILKPKFVAEKVFEAQTTNRRNVSLPADVGFVVNLKTRFIPEKAANYFADHFKADVLSDLDVQRNGRSKEINKN